MEPKESVVAQLERVLKAQEEQTKKSHGSNSLWRANELYNKLVNNGVIKKRGYTLRGIEDSHLFQVKLNS